MLYARKVRHRKLDRVRHSEQLLNFLDAQATRLSGTSDGFPVVFNHTTDVIDFEAHPVTEGYGPAEFYTAGTLPTGISADTLYWLYPDSVDTISIHTNYEDSLVGDNAVTFTSNGSGTIEVRAGCQAADVYEAMLNGKTAEQIRAMTEFTDLGV